MLVNTERLHLALPVQHVRRIRSVQHPLAMQLNRQTDTDGQLLYEHKQLKCTCSATRRDVAPSQNGESSSSQVEFASAIGYRHGSDPEELRSGSSRMQKNDVAVDTHQQAIPGRELDRRRR